MTPVASKALILGGFGATAVLAGAAVATVPPQFILVGLVALFLPLLPQRFLVATAYTIVAVLGLIRRLLSPGRIDYDPLLLVPIVLIGAAIVFGVARPGKGPYRLAESAIATLCAVAILSQMVVGNLDFAAVYAVILQATAFLIILCTSRGSLPDVWSIIYRWIVPLGALLGAYGIAQFFILPSWDRSWMIASRLVSIGQPEPGLVRVFSTSESPGTFALLMGLVAIVGVVQLGQTTGVRRVAMAVAIGLALFALLLTGVRSALVGIFVALVYLAFKGRSPKQFASVLGFGAGGVWLLTYVLATFGGGDSTILNSDRFTLSLSNDSSVQARLSLVDLIGPALLRPFGRGAGGSDARVQAFDNTYIDILVSFGPIALVLLVVVMAATLRSALTLPRLPAGDNLALGAAGVYVVVMTMAGSFFATTTGLIVAMVIGSLLSRAHRDPRSQPISDEVHEPTSAPGRFNQARTT